MKKSLTQIKNPHWLKKRFPEYEEIDLIPASFSDSTHQLFSLQTSVQGQKNDFLKVCNHTSSPFWQIMNDLFDYDLSAEIPFFSKTYAYIEQATELDIPELIIAENFEDKAFILTSVLEGEAVVSMTDQMVKQLAIHLAQLHTCSKNTWGALNQPNLESSDWVPRLETCLTTFTERSANKWGGGSLESESYLNLKHLKHLKHLKYLKQALESCSHIKTKSFVPMMPDLRWDQFLQKDDVITSLVDLDAFVFAPRELDFVILELLLTTAQIKTFSETYEKSHQIPDITPVRPAYRLLLFYMQILGEMDLDEWMNKQILFD